MTHEVTRLYWANQDGMPYRFPFTDLDPLDALGRAKQVLAIGGKVLKMEIWGRVLNGDEIVMMLHTYGALLNGYPKTH